MPVIEGVTTKSATQVWASPDGQRKIHDVQMDYKGQLFKASTFSDAIAVVGWTGSVESYEKPGKNGSQTFVKQPPKEETSYTPKSGAAKPAYQGKDEMAIKAMWAIGQSIQAHNATAGLDTADIPSVEAFAVELFALVDRVKVSDQEPENLDDVNPVRGDETDKELLANMDKTLAEPVTEALDMSEIDKVFGPQEGEKAWPKS